MSKQPKTKWRYAMGTTSRVPGSFLHYLIIDVDQPRIPFPLLRWVTEHTNATGIYLQRTNHGWHIFTNHVSSFKSIIQKLTHRKHVDQKWLSIAKQRGYLFLADKDKTTFPWPVGRMQIYYKEKKNKNVN
jgi:hypothetical protein